MKRVLILLLALIGATTVAAAPSRDWSAIAAANPQGNYVIGNPKARVKLVEYVSYTCPHCRHFTQESAATLKGQMIRSGSTSLEVRSAILNKLDLPATLLAKCIGPANFPRFHDALYAQQEAWVGRGAAWDEANAARMRLYPDADRLRGLADAAGLTDLARANGMPAATIDQCFKDPANLTRVLQTAQAVSERITGTPSFELNGKFIERVDWKALEPQLRAAGAK